MASDAAGQRVDDSKEQQPEQPPPPPPQEQQQQEQQQEQQQQEQQQEQQQQQHPQPPPPPPPQPQRLPDAVLTGPVPLARGRQPRDPQATTLTYNVSSLDDFEAALRSYLSHPPEDPAHTDCQLAFWINAVFPVVLPPPTQTQASHARQPRFVQHPDAPPGYQPASSLQQYGRPANAYDTHTHTHTHNPFLALFTPGHADPSATNGASASTANAPTAAGKTGHVHQVHMSIREALQPTPDPKDKMRKQRAIAKCCVDAIQRTDGFRYSFHNCWNSREDDSFRFSYYCNDSLLNKDRAANGKGSKLGKRATKPVYDCKGVLSVKFSASKQTLDVFYKHNPIHKTYEERAPAPRKDSKRRKYLEENEPEVLERIVSRPRAPRANSDSQPMPKKKKTPEEQKSSTSLENDLRAQSLRSLLELIRTDEAPAPSLPALPPPPPPPPPPPERQPTVHVPPPPLLPLTMPPPLPAHHQQLPPLAHPRRKPRNSCDVCKTKKTKCDGTRPVCNTCIEKNRQCTYTADPLWDDGPPSTVPGAAEPIWQAQAATEELSELERMKRELEEAKARIKQLEEGQRRSSLTPSHTPQMSRQPLPSPPHSQPQSQPDATAPPSAQSQQRQQQQQGQPQQIQLQGTQQQVQKAPFNHYASHTLHPYELHRRLSLQSMAAQNRGRATQSPNQQMHAPSTGLTPTAESVNSFGREFTWPTSPYYGYNPAQPHQPDQWTAARNSGTFR